MNYKKFFNLLNASLFFNFCFFAAAVVILAVCVLSHSSIGLNETDNKFMDLAYEEAAKAKAEGSFPAGAVLVVDGQVIASGHNLVAASGDLRDHAEMIAINEALKAMNLNDFSNYSGKVVLYTTYEPCPMCEGFIIWKKVDRVIVGKRKDIQELLSDNFLSRFEYRLHMRSGLSEYKHDQLVK